ncbi:40S ribosomal protein S3-3-like [Senna tora]|uniref:40S ribosomal protein S3-3-like n=1 Tax=Senna tora TaxID=362788 RepID=A0A834WEC1_9FABA|nr:40S ribosomal protein S3-3-like [Senna tora]
MDDDAFALTHYILGVLGIQVKKSCLIQDPKAKQGPTKPLPDLVIIHPPKEQDDYTVRPLSQPASIENAAV